MKEKKLNRILNFVAITVASVTLLTAAGCAAAEHQNEQSEEKELQKSNSPLSSVVSEVDSEPSSEYGASDTEKRKISDSSDFEEVTINGKEYYHRLTEATWQGEYHKDIFYTAEPLGCTQEVVSYEKYLSLIDNINQYAFEPIKPYYTDAEKNYIILADANGYSWCTQDLIDCIDDTDVSTNIVLFGQSEARGVMADGSGFFIAIPTDRPAETKLEYIECYSTEEIENLKKYGEVYDPYQMMTDKPVIYLYPTEETDITVKLPLQEKITCSYPKYQGEWLVRAFPDGSLTDLKTGRNLYSLYYEGTNTGIADTEEGFVIKGEDSAEFLEEKLAVLGMTETEAEEFIIYWLPRLEANEYNYIRFAEESEINENMPLQISPQPDKVIRVLMVFKGLDKPISVHEQKLAAQERTGFTAVEWGGTEIR